ncbi:hypothetical protein Nepgr_007236 [Nepenthes gracilis]|uniref:Uncharacterized protein n=1 Tax=Nepenthes gracilis TaxID=150966 RepID=A0AAD3S6T0_NEPGR|nr:hypothetical protein Nepgr_007236 [Nepenthes gracilis]
MWPPLSVICDAYLLFERSMLAYKMDNLNPIEMGEAGEELTEVDILKDVICLLKFETKILQGFWLLDDNEINLGFLSMLDRKPELANRVLQNPHNVEQWNRRVKCWVLCYFIVRHTTVECVVFQFGSRWSFHTRMTQNGYSTAILKAPVECVKSSFPGYIATRGLWVSKESNGG